MEMDDVRATDGRTERGGTEERRKRGKRLGELRELRRRPASQTTDDGRRRLGKQMWSRRRRRADN